MPIVKVSNEIKNVKEEIKQNSHSDSAKTKESVRQNSHSESTKTKESVRQNNHSESKWTKTEITPPPQEEVKKQKSDVVIQKIVKHDKETIQKPAASVVDKRAQVKQAIREQIKSETPKKDATANSTQELLNRVKKAKETIDTNPVMKIEKTKKNSVESKEEDKKPKAQEVGTSRFSGEPAMRDFDRKSIFSGWPNRNNSQKRI